MKKRRNAGSIDSEVTSALPTVNVDSLSGRSPYGDEHKLFERALSWVFARDAESLEKSAALLTACCMISEISLEKLFKNLKNLRKSSSKCLNGSGKKSKKKKKKLADKTKQIKKKTNIWKNCIII